MDQSTPPAGLLANVSQRALAITKALDGVGPLVARITLGVIFASSGLGKLQHLDKVTAFFTDLGIPAPHFQAAFVGSVELFGGILLLVGLGSRICAMLLASTMVVAIITAKRADIHSFTDFLGLEEWVYLVMLGWLVLAGPGRFAIDAILVKKMKLGAAVSGPATPALL